MRTLLLIVVTLSIFTICYCSDVEERSKSASRKHWEKFKSQYRKQYSTETEHNRRFEIFHNNLKLIEQLQAEEQGTARYAINKFADLHPEEFADKYLMKVDQAGILQMENEMPVLKQRRNDVPIPTNFDWRDHQAVTAVDNLGACDGSWAAAAVQAIESAWYLAGHPLISLSVQQILDCFNDPTAGSSTCNGGDIQKAYNYIIQYGLQARSSYAYRANQGKCNYNRSSVVAKIDGFVFATANRSEFQMQYSLLEYGPLAICLDGGYRWQFYAGGVISHLCGETINHCVLLTGYKDYYEAPWGTYEVWNVKNNWGRDWGEDGYCFIERGNDVCGVAKMATFPSITSAGNNNKF